MKRILICILILCLVGWNGQTKNNNSSNKSNGLALKFKNTIAFVEGINTVNDIKDDFIIQNNTNKISDKQTIALPKGFYILDSTMINLKTKNYKILTLEKEEIKNKDNAQHNSNPIVILEKTKNKYFKKSSNYDLVFKYDDNCPADGYGGIVIKNNYFTIQQIFCMDFLFVNSYTTFKIDENTNTIHLHKYGEEYTNRSNPDEKIPTRIWTKKDFGNVAFENVTEDFLKGLRKNNPKN